MLGGGILVVMMEGKEDSSADRCECLTVLLLRRPQWCMHGCTWCVFVKLIARAACCETAEAGINECCLLLLLALLPQQKLTPGLLQERTRHEGEVKLARMSQ